MHLIPKLLVKLLIYLVLSLTLFSCTTSDNDTEEETISYNVNFPNVTDYPIIGTGQTQFFDGVSELTSPINENSEWFGQNANYLGAFSNYTELEYDWITDNNTGLVWTKEFPSKMTYSEVEKKRDSMIALTNISWRIPTVKELYSLMNYGIGHVSGHSVITPFVDQNLFNIKLGVTSDGEREIDGQIWSSTFYNGTINNNDAGGHMAPNPVDGRIKTYPKINKSTNVEKTYYLLLCAGNENYGVNDFTDNQNGTVIDNATNLMWAKDDGTEIFTFLEALAFAETSELAGYTDWRLPDVKELQSIVDYSRGTQSAEGLPAINTTYFNCTPITNTNSPFATTYGYYWSNTTLSDGTSTNPKVGAEAMYVCFGRALGESNGEIVDWHGAGAARSDPKTLTTAQEQQTPKEILEYFGPQLDERRYYNKVRLVRYLN